MIDSIDRYRLNRRNLQVPARQAVAMARAQAALAANVAELGFRWIEDRQYRRSASWRQEGFDLTARLVSYDDGWWTQGVDTLGRFSDRREPGAIRHHRGGPNACRWFVPINPTYGREDYRRACAYGDDWSYLGMQVSASRAGIVLGTADLWGIESDAGDDHVTEIALDIAADAVHRAAAALTQLCGCH
jgi:hypothetical protein